VKRELEVLDEAAKEAAVSVSSASVAQRLGRREARNRVDLQAVRTHQDWDRPDARCQRRDGRRWSRSGFLGHQRPRAESTIGWHLLHHHQLRLLRLTVSRILVRHGLVTPTWRNDRRRSTHPSKPQPNESGQSDFIHYRLATGTDVEIITWLDDHSRQALHGSLTPRDVGWAVGGEAGGFMTWSTRGQVGGSARGVDPVTVQAWMGARRSRRRTSICIIFEVPLTRPEWRI